MSNTQQEVIDIVVEQLGVDSADVAPDKSFVGDLNADSLDLTELIMTFEEKFGFEINFFESAENLLIEINKIEKELGRVRSSIRNEPREIDIDIIFFGNQIINKKDLVVPHPRFRERLFVLEPLNDIAPNFLDPITNKTINQLLINAQNSSN